MAIHPESWQRIGRAVTASEQQATSGVGRAATPRNVDTPILLAKTTTEHLKGTTEDVELIFGPKGGEASSGDIVACYNRFVTLQPNAVCLIRWVDQGWEIVSAHAAGTSETPCGCSQCLDRELMTVDLGAGWFGAEIYVVGSKHLEHDGGGVWTSDTFLLTCDSSTDPIDQRVVHYKLTATGVALNDLTLELIDADDNVIATWRNTVTAWKPHCGMTLFLVSSAGTDCPGHQPNCSMCIELDEDLLPDP